MRNRRKVRPVRSNQHNPNIEILEARALLTAAATNIPAPSQTYDILTEDYPLQGAYAIPSSLQGGDSYTLRQLVGYYDYYYNSTENWTIDLSATTYTLSNINANFAGSKWAGRLDNDNQVGALDLFPTSYTGIGKLILAGPTGSYATITCDDVSLSSGGSIPLDRIFHVLSGASLGLQNIAVKGGMAIDNSTAEGSDAEGGGILVDSGASLSLSDCEIKNNYAIGSTGPNVIGVTSSGRQGAGYNASGGGIYGAAGSSISIDATTVISDNFAQGGHGGNVSNSTIGHGGDGGSAFGAGIAVDAPTSGSTQVVSTVTTQLTIDSGAKVSNNYINQATSSGMIINRGGTGGSDAGGKGGSGGNAYGAGLYMGTGQLNLNGGSTLAPLVFSNNSEIPGPGFSTGTSSGNAGANGLANGAGATVSPGLVTLSDSPTSGGILQFSNNLVAGVSGEGFYLPTVLSTTDTGSTTANDEWTLRTAVAAVNPLVASGMDITLNLPVATLALLSSSSGTNTGSLAVVNTGDGALKIVGAGASSSIINAASLGASAFAFTDAKVTLSGLEILGAVVSGNGGAINALNSTVAVSNASLNGNAVSTTTGDGGGIYQSGGTLSLVNTNLTKNKAATGGGIFLGSGTAFSMSGGTASGNSAASSGGGLSASSSSVTLNDVMFSGNVADGGAGGAIGESGGTLTVSSSSTLFQGNSASTNGGGINVSAGCVFNLTNGALLLNTAGQSGGGVAATGASVILNTANLSGNTASGVSGSGGGLYQSGGTVKLKNATVQNNRADQGGGLGVSGGKFKMTNGSVTGNSIQGGGSGGGLYATGNPAVTLATLALTSNSAPSGSGGGIYQNGGTLSVENGTKIKLNTAVQGAGAYISGATANINGGGIKNNTASANGGGVFSTNNALSLTGVSVISNKVTNGSSVTGNGGGLYQSNGGALMLSDGTTVEDNSAQDGGGIFLSSSGFTDKGSTVKANTAVTAGGGFYAPTNTQSLNFTNADVSSNALNATGAANGGGLYISGGTLNANSINVLNNKITAANNTTVEGGGLYANGTAVKLNGGSGVSSTFDGNSLIGDGSGTAFGGAISLNNGASLSAQSNLTIKNNSITDTASGVGGGIAFFVNTSYSTSDTLTSKGNSASAGGNDVAFVVGDTSDNNNTTTETGPAGINYFTSNAGSLRSALSYCQNWMTNNTNDESMAIILTAGSTYGLVSSYGSLTASVPSGDTLTVIGENSTSTGSSTITATGINNRVFFINGAGSFVLQNMVVTGGWVNQEYFDNNNSAGGGIYLDGGTLTLNNAAVQDNTAVATIAGATGVVGANYGHSGGVGGNGRSAYGGGIYMNQGTLNLLGNSSITDNTVTGSHGGAGGKGGNGRTNGATTFDCDFTNGGKGGNGGTGGNALGGGLYEYGGTLNAPSSTLNVTNNIANAGAGGAAGSGGQSGNGKYCGWGTSGSGSAGAVGTANANYDLPGGGQCYSQSAVNSALSIGDSATSVPHLQRLPGVSFELFSADGQLIATASSDQGGGFNFGVPFTGEGYVQVEKIPVFTLAPLGTQVAPGVASSFDPATGRTAMMSFLAGVPINQKLVLVMTPMNTTFQTGTNYVQLMNQDTETVVWRDTLKSNFYHGGFTFAALDISGDTTDDYLVIPKTGATSPMLVNGRTGAVTPISGTVSSGLTSGFAMTMSLLTGNGSPQLVLYPANDRSGRISVIDLKSKSVAWTSSNSVRGGMTVSFASYSTTGVGPLDVVEISDTLDKNQDGHNWQEWFDGKTGKTINIIDPTPSVKKSMPTMPFVSMPTSSQTGMTMPMMTTKKSPTTMASSVSLTSSKHRNVARAMILSRNLPTA